MHFALHAPIIKMHVLQSTLSGTFRRERSPNGNDFSKPSRKTCIVLHRIGWMLDACRPEKLPAMRDDAKDDGGQFFFHCDRQRSGRQEVG